MTIVDLRSMPENELNKISSEFLNKNYFLCASYLIENILKVQDSCDKGLIEIEGCIAEKAKIFDNYLPKMLSNFDYAELLKDFQIRVHYDSESDLFIADHKRQWFDPVKGYSIYHILHEVRENVTDILDGVCESYNISEEDIEDGNIPQKVQDEIAYDLNNLLTMERILDKIYEFSVDEIDDKNCEYNGISLRDYMRYEILEYWIITDPSVFKLLARLGAYVMHVGEVPVYGRFTSGQVLSLDYEFQLLAMMYNRKSVYL